MKLSAILVSALRILWLGQGLIVVGVVFLMLLATLRPATLDTASAELVVSAEPASPPSASPAPRTPAEVYFVCSDREATWIRVETEPHATVYITIEGITPPELAEALRLRASLGLLEIVLDSDCS